MPAAAGGGLGQPAAVAAAAPTGSGAQPGAYGSPLPVHSFGGHAAGMGTYSGGRVEESEDGSDERLRKAARLAGPNRAHSLHSAGDVSVGMAGVPGALPLPGVAQMLSMLASDEQLRNIPPHLLQARPGRGSVQGALLLQPLQQVAAHGLGLLCCRPA